jgi:hypothetical protein
VTRYPDEERKIHGEQKEVASFKGKRRGDLSLSCSYFIMFRSAKIATVRTLFLPSSLPLWPKKKNISWPNAMCLPWIDVDRSLEIFPSVFYSEGLLAISVTFYQSGVLASGISLSWGTIRGGRSESPRRRGDGSQHCRLRGALAQEENSWNSFSFLFLIPHLFSISSSPSSS